MLRNHSLEPRVPEKYFSDEVCGRECLSQFYLLHKLWLIMPTLTAIICSSTIVNQKGTHFILENSLRFPWLCDTLHASSEKYDDCEMRLFLLDLMLSIFYWYGYYREVEYFIPKVTSFSGKSSVFLLWVCPSPLFMSVKFPF